MTNCPKCGAGDAGEREGILRCRGCGHAFQDPPAPPKLEDLIGKAVKDMEEATKQTATEVVQKALTHARAPEVLRLRKKAGQWIWWSNFNMIVALVNGVLIFIGPFGAREGFFHEYFLIFLALSFGSRMIGEIIHIRANTHK